MNRTFSLGREGAASRLEDVGRACLGWWCPQSVEQPSSLEDRAADIGSPLVLVIREGKLECYPASAGNWTGETSDALPVAGYVPGLLPSQLGDPGFRADHGLRFPYIAGAMANGIGSVEIVRAMGEAGMLGFFGAAGLPPQTVARAIDRIRLGFEDKPFGINLIHTPQQPRIEARIVEILLEKQVRLAEASAYLGLTLPVVRYRLHGIHEDEYGRIVAPNKIIAKISRVEVASKFMAPAPEKFIAQLLANGELTEAQAQMARRIPVAQDFTAEADSGGHTDNRPAIALLPTMLALRDRVQKERGYDMPMRVGLAGGIATPASAAAAFAMGAAFVLAGSIHQACIESGTSDAVRAMLAEAEQADIAMAPAADMFEMGVDVQVLKRGTMFPMRAAKLYELYRSHEGLGDLPPHSRAMLEKSVFRMPLEEVWSQTQAYFQDHDPRQIERAERDPKHKMALVFRWYLGKSSHWANHGEPDRKIDYQIWCGPAMGAFNEWVAGSFLERPEQRRIVAVARNILYGAALAMRWQSLKTQGMLVAEPPLQPRETERLKEFFI